MCDPQRSTEEICSNGQCYIVQRPSTINNLIADQRSLSNLIDSVSVSNFLQGLTIRLPIICTLPERLGYYSCRLLPDGETDSYFPNKGSLPYLRPDYLEMKNLNLFEGFSHNQAIYRILPETDHVFQWIHESPDPEICLNINFICTNSRILRSILNIPYNGAICWTTLAIKIGRTIYLTMRDPNIFIRRGGALSKSQVTNAHVGYKFSELITLRPNGSKPRTYPSGNRDSFYTVNKLDVGQYKIIYPNRVDCVIDSRQYHKPIGQMRFAQLRNRPCEWHREQRPEINIIRTISWWIGSFLGGADTIVCGEKSTQFEIRDITTIKSDDLLNVQSRNGAKWTPKKCIDHLKKTLCFIDDHIHEEKVVYRFRWNRHKQNIEYRKLRESVTTFIPPWYLYGK